MKTEIQKTLEVIKQIEIANSENRLTSEQKNLMLPELVKMKKIIDEFNKLTKRG